MDKPVADPETVLKEELPVTASWGEQQSSNSQDDGQKCSESAASWSEQRSSTAQDDGQTCPERCPEDRITAEWVNYDDTTRTASPTAVALPTGDAANGRSGERDDRKEANLAKNRSTERADTEQVRGSNADSSVGKAGYESIYSRDFCSVELEQNPVETKLTASDDTQWKVDMELSTTEAAPVDAEAASRSPREAQDGAQYNAADTAQVEAKTASSSVTTSMGSRFTDTEKRNTDNSPDSLQIGDFPCLDASDIGGKTRNAPVVARDHHTSGMPGSGMGHALHGDRERRESSSFEKPADDCTLPGVAPEMRCPSSSSGPDNSLVRVAGMDQSMDLNLLQLYFGNTKHSGGGTCTIRDDQRHQLQAYVILSFEDPEVAARVLDGRHHKLSGKSLVVSPAGPSSLSRTVRVEGGSVATNTEVMELYFDDPKNGGGDIEEINVDDKQITWITFQEARVADEVVKMQHTVFGVPLTVTKARGDGREPGTSITPPGHPSQAHSQPHQTYGRDEEEDPDEATTLKATYTAGSPTPSSRHGSFSSSTLSVAIISRFASSCESELNQRGTSPESLALSPPVDGLQRHRANGGQASAFRPSQPTSLHPAQSLRTSAGFPNSLPNFNGRSDPLGRLGAIPSTTATAPIARAPAGPREEGCSGSSGRDGGFEASTVAIRGLRRSTSLDALRSYFDNTRMSGGGEVLDVRLSPVVDGTAFVSFCHEQDAANVKARGHKLEDKDLKVVDVVKNQLLLGSLPHCVSEDLRHFVEVKASSALERVKFGEDGSVAIVTFEEEIDLQHVRDSLTAHSFKGKTLHVEPVPVTDTILVRNLPRAPLLTEESLENLFSNTRYSGGQDVTSVTLNVGNNYAQIAFADPSVASRVAGRKIEYHQRELDISLFNDCLGPSGGLAEQPLKKPEPKQITEVESVKKISLLTKVPCLASRLHNVLEQCHARLDLPDNAGEWQQVSLVCTLSADVEGAPCLAASWTEDVTSALNDHLQRSVYVKSEPLNADAGGGGGGGGVTWVQNLADEAGVGAVFDEKAGTVYVLCDRDESRERVDAVLARIQAENRKRREAKITLQVPIAKGKLPLLKSHHVGKEIKEKFPELCVAFDMDNACVSLEGAEEAVSAMRASIEEVSGLIKSKAHRWNSPTASLLLSSAEARNAVEMACRKESSEGTVHFNDSGFEVHSFCEEEAEQMLSRGADAVKEKIIQIDEGLKTALELPEWEDFRKSIEEESEGLLQFVQTDASLTVVGVGPTAHDRFKAVEEFLEEHVRLKRTIALGMPFHAVLQTLLHKKHEDDHLRVHDFALGKNACEVVVEGNKGGIQAVEELVKELTNLSALPQE